MGGPRGTTNGNVRGSSYARRERKHYLLVAFALPGLPGVVECFNCPAMLDFFTVTVDRITPGCQGGTYRRTNIRPACLSCNSSLGGAVRSRLLPSERKARDMKIDEQVRQMHPPRYTRKQAATIVGRDLDTLKRWKRDGVYVPTERRAFGQIMVDLYTDEDIKALKQIAKSIKPGRRPTTAQTA